MTGTVAHRFKNYLSNAKQEIQKLNVPVMSMQIIEPPASTGPLSLRTQSTLMRGLVIVYRCDRHPLLSFTFEYLEAEAQALSTRTRMAMTSVAMVRPLTFFQLL